MNKRKLVLLMSLIGILLIIGGVSMHLYNKHKQEELKRNRKYEASLVKALKNSYERIEEIEISNPTYVSPPGDWSCDIVITFKDNEKISYGIGHNLDDKQNYNGRQKTDKDWAYLNSHKGTTTNKVRVIYSNGEAGDQ